MVLKFLIILYVFYFMVLMCLINNMCIMILLVVCFAVYFMIFDVTKILLFSG